MDYQSHSNHIYQCSVIENNLQARKKEQQQRQQKAQQQQALRDNLALRQLRRQQQQQLQQQQQQPQINAVDLDREDTPPNDLQEVIRHPQRPQKERRAHPALMNFKNSSGTKWRRQKSCSRNFIKAFDDTQNQIPKDTNVIHVVHDQITINDDDSIAFTNDSSNGPYKHRPRAKSMSSFKPVTISNEEAEFIASSVMQVLDEKQAYAFVKDKLMRNVHISSMTKEEISTIVKIHEISLSTNSSTSTSTEGDLSFRSATTSPDRQSPVSVDINSGAVQFSPSKKKTPKKVPPPTRPSLKQERSQWKQQFAKYDQAYSQLIDQLVNPQQPQPSTSKSVQQQPPVQQQPLLPPATSPTTGCNLCDNPRFFLFSPETRKNLTCSCSNRVLNNWKEPADLPTPVALPPQQSQQRQQQETETPSKRVTRYKGERQGVWDKTSQMFNKFKK